MHFPPNNWQYDVGYLWSGEIFKKSLTINFLIYVEEDFKSPKAKRGGGR